MLAPMTRSVLTILLARKTVGVLCLVSLGYSGSKRHINGSWGACSPAPVVMMDPAHLLSTHGDVRSFGLDVEWQKQELVEPGMIKLRDKISIHNTEMMNNCQVQMEDDCRVAVGSGKDPLHLFPENPENCLGVGQDIEVQKKGMVDTSCIGSDEKIGMQKFGLEIHRALADTAPVMAVDPMYPQTFKITDVGFESRCWLKLNKKRNPWLHI